MLSEKNLFSQWVESYTENLHSWAFHKVSEAFHNIGPGDDAKSKPIVKPGLN